MGESASDILRRLLQVDAPSKKVVTPSAPVENPPVTPAWLQDSSVNTLDTTKAMRELLISDELAGSTKAIDRFLLILSTLYRLSPKSFAQATEVKGRKRVYFADNQETLLAHGKTTKPRAIPDTPFWVITNNNTSRKRQMVEQVMAHMAFPQELIDKVTNAI
ncbi:replication initiation negative regulator SeqA [Vibrio sp. HB161653]|uniref:replication initiation negative regulator SeqA n=1 Tax=Vibrio sp. HB161653 TaxID=3068274 RepID=UPI00353170DE